MLKAKAWTWQQGAKTRLGAPGQCPSAGHSGPDPRPQRAPGAPWGGTAGRTRDSLRPRESALQESFAFLPQEQCSAVNTCRMSFLLTGKDQGLERRRHRK